LEKEIAKLTIELEHHATDDMLLEYSDKLHQFEEAGGYTVEHKTEEVLQGLGFSNDDLKRPYKEFSGGWRMRVLLAKMILQQPDLLLLDEPTNHLDLPSIEWLEKYLQHYKGSVVIVSHDKYFLNRMVKKIVEVYQKELHIYNGNYDFYETEKLQRIELQQRAFENQQEYIRQQERFIERFRAKATKAAQAQSAMKRLDKLDRIEDVEIERPDIRINFTIDKTPGRVLAELKHVSKHFKDIEILKDASIEIDRGDKIALIGANGKGKSTLLRIVAGTESFEGERKWGHNVDEAFYAQHQLEALNINNTILEELKEAGSKKTELELRTVLGCFLFSGDDVDKKIKVLSGGEKARVALAKTIISKANFLLLDEPTNHLDLHSTELLADSLNRYGGSYLLVSHDRYFISKTANKIWEIVDHQIKEFKGSYQEWVEWKERMSSEVKVQSVKSEKGAGNREDGKGGSEAVNKNKTQEIEANQISNVSSGKPINKSIQSAVKKELQKLQRQFQKIEEDIAQANKLKTELELQLAAPDIYADKQRFVQTEEKYKNVTSRLVQLNQDYEQTFEKIIELEEQ
jgi:ATP-binding cassette subfamily F protein 3